MNFFINLCNKNRAVAAPTMRGARRNHATKAHEMSWVCGWAHCIKEALNNSLYFPILFKQFLFYLKIKRKVERKQIGQPLGAICVIR